MPFVSTTVKLTGLPAIDFKARRTPTQSVVTLGVTPTRPAGVKVTRNPLDFNDLWNAYMADSYIARAVNRYRHLVFGTGIGIDGDAQAVRYLQARFKIADRVSGFGWDGLMRSLLFDYILYGNAFAVKSYTSQIPSLYGRRLTGKVVAAWFPVSPRLMTPSIDDSTGLVRAWTMTYEINGKRYTREFKVDDVVHLTYNRGSGYLWGVPLLQQVVEDVRAFRQLEEGLLRLIHKFSYPIMVLYSADTTGTGIGVRADMTALANAVNSMYQDGAIVLMPGQDIKMLGAESHALRVDGYIQVFKKRIFSGLGLSEVMIGDQPEPLERQAELERQVRDTVMDIQQQFGEGVMSQIVGPLLEQAGWSPDVAWLEFQDPDPVAALRRETMLANLYTLNAITWSEMRDRMNLPADVDMKDTYLWQVQIPKGVEVLKARMGLVDDQGDDSDVVKRPRGRPSKF